MSEWYYVEKGEQRGPVDHHTLVGRIGRGELGADTLVWRDGMADWNPARSVAALSAPAAGIRDAGGPGLAAAPHAVAGIESGGFDPFSQEHYGTIAVTYAGFWKRFAAVLLDGFILWIPQYILQMIVAMIWMTFNGDSDNPASIFLMAMFSWQVSFGLQLAYFSFFESGSWQATPGKKILKIKVTDADGRRVTLARAFGRNAGKLLSSLVLGIGYIMAGFTERKQALHDIMANCLVVNA